MVIRLKSKNTFLALSITLKPSLFFIIFHIYLKSKLLVKRRQCGELFGHGTDEDATLKKMMEE